MAKVPAAEAGLYGQATIKPFGGYSGKGDPPAAQARVAGGRGSRIAPAGSGGPVKGYTPGTGVAATGSFGPKGRSVSKGSSRNAKPGRAGKRK